MVFTYSDRFSGRRTQICCLEKLSGVGSSLQGAEKKTVVRVHAVIVRYTAGSMDIIRFLEATWSALQDRFLAMNEFIGEQRLKGRT